MAADERQRVVDALLDRYGPTLADEAEIRLRDSPNVLFQAFQLGLLLDARVHPDEAVRTLVDLRGRRWATTSGMLDAPHDEIVGVLTDHGYPEGDASRIAVTMSDAALHLEDDHGGDLGGLRKVAGRDPDQERELLRRFAKIRDKGIDGFFREVQVLWQELVPSADKETLDAARRLGLGEDAAALRDLAGDDERFVRLADALLRARHDDHGIEAVREAAGVSG